MRPLVNQKLAGHPYLVTISTVLLAFLLNVALLRFTSTHPPFLFFFGAVAVTAAFTGAVFGVLATALSTIAVYVFFFAPVGALTAKPYAALVALLTFTLLSLLVCWLFHHLHAAREKVVLALETTEADLERAEESNRLKRNFIANMSHEIRAPLSAVLGYSDLLAGGTLSIQERQSYMDRLKLNASNLVYLVTDLLDVTEINSAYFVANRRWINLRSFMQEVQSVFEHAALEKGLKFHIHFRGKVPTYIESDRDQLMQTLRHVVGNAIRYSDHGIVELSVSASKADSERREVAFIVSDQGPGITADVKQKLFRPFSSDDSQKKAPGSSTGLGLTVARKLSRGLGGDVKLAKSDRRGSTFLITIDAGPAHEMNEFFDQLSDTAPKEAVPVDDPHALEGARVLVVDDSADSALLVSRMLATVGADVKTATRGQEGVERALQDRPDIVLMDIEMPEVDGYEATRRLRAHGFDGPIIALSAHVMKEDREEAAKSGTDEYLMKPVSRRALLEMVARFVRSRHPELQPAH